MLAPFPLRLSAPAIARHDADICHSQGPSPGMVRRFAFARRSARPAAGLRDALG